MTLISIEGNIGSGKSTLVNKIREKFPHVVIVDEPVEEWSSITDTDGTTILEKYYGDQERWAFAFQMMAFITRVRRLSAIPKDKVVITERSVFTDKAIFAKMLYDDKKISEIEYKIYLKWFDEFASSIKVDHVVYINTPPEVCHERVIKRGRQGESIPLEYLQECHKYHEDWLSNNSQVTENPCDNCLKVILAVNQPQHGC